MGSIGTMLVLALAWSLAGVLGLFQGGYSSWFVFEALSVLLAIAGAVRFGSLQEVAVEHGVSAERLTEGGEQIVSVRLRHRSLIPLLWLLVEEEWTRSGETAPRKAQKLLFPWFRRTLEFQYTLAGLPRGEYRLTGIEVTAGDGIGFAKRRRRPDLGHGAQFVAYPMELPLQWNGFTARESDGRPVPGATMSVSGGYPTGLRDYVTGDPLSSLHWKATARRGTLTVKEADPHESQQVLLLLDTSAATYAGLGDWAPEALEASVRAAAGLLRTAGERGWALAFACCHAGLTGAGGSGSRERSLLLERLARVDGKGAVRFADAVAGAAAAQPAATALALVTPRVDEPLLAALRSLQRRGRRVLLALPHAAPQIAARERERLAALRELGCDVLPLPPQLQPPLAAPLGRSARASAPAQGGAAHARA